MKIENLTQLERSIKVRMPKEGCFDERDEYLLKHGLYQDWRSLFVKYANLALDGDAEALKRSLFFLWYQCAEPNQLSGINELDENLAKKILIKIDTMSESGKLDSELAFMLPFYYQITEWYFERFSNLENILKASIANPNLWEKEAPKVNWGNRGVMGDYWSSKGL
jgi:hypothetical protein